MEHIIALITDFGLRNHFAGTMKGVILSIDPGISIVDITHQVQPQNILEAAYILADSLPYWPAETIFVAVVDPGVGTERRSLVVKTGTGHQILCPDNGVLTIVEQEYGLINIYEISRHNRLPGTEAYFTFHGRDIYAYNAGRLATGKILPSDLGPQVRDPIIKLPIEKPEIHGESITGNIIKVEDPFGNLCTNIPAGLLSELSIEYGDQLDYTMIETAEKHQTGKLPFVKTFGEVAVKQALAYMDSSGRLGFAVNQGNFSNFFNMKAGLLLQVKLKKSIS